MKYYIDYQYNKKKMNSLFTQYHRHLYKVKSVDTEKVYSLFVFFSSFSCSAFSLSFSV